MSKTKWTFFSSLSSVTTCIRSQAGYCCIQYFPCPEFADSFSIDSAIDIATGASFVNDMCSMDYVSIPGLIRFQWIAPPLSQMNEQSLVLSTEPIVTSINFVYNLWTNLRRYPFYSFINQFLPINKTESSKPTIVLAKRTFV